MSSILKVDTIQTTAGAAPTAGSLGFAAGAVLQTVIADTNSTINTNNGSDTEVSTSLRASITPASTSNKVLIFLTYHVVTNSGSTHNAVFVKRSADSGSSFSNLSNYLSNTGNEIHRNAHSSGEFGQHTQVILDSPSSTSSLMYSLFFRTNGGNLRINDNGAGTRIILQEISG